MVICAVRPLHWYDFTLLPFLTCGSIVSSLDESEDVMTSKLAKWPGQGGSPHGSPMAISVPPTVELEIERPAWGDLLRAVRTDAHCSAGNTELVLERELRFERKATLSLLVEAATAPPA